MKVYAATDIGRVRPINEDSYYAPKPGEYFCGRCRRHGRP